MKSAKAIFKRYLKEKGMLPSHQREEIFDTFMRTKNHPTVDSLYDVIQKKYPKIGLATVYRTMRIICDADLAREVDFGDGARRFERKFKRHKHYHLICIKCGKIIEVKSPDIERLQEKLAGQHDFSATKNTMKIFGVCNKCQQNEKRNR
jgi:Fur family ferric uptake transcriptional regulator